MPEPAPLSGFFYGLFVPLGPSVGGRFNTVSRRHLANASLPGWNARNRLAAPGFGRKNTHLSRSFHILTGIRISFQEIPKPVRNSLFQPGKHKTRQEFPKPARES
jgi:hypothetical protein